MATSKETAAFILEELGGTERFSVKPMFGEFAIYADGKTVGFICDDQLLLKIMPECADLDPLCERTQAYPGSKDYYLVPEDMITGDRKLPRLMLRMAEALPMPKVKKKKAKG
jgi:TfoX/Sxy family transcriptional regulator of competence genes